MKQSILRCDHCLIDVREGQAILDEIKGQRRVFCCKGCQGIYRLLSDEDLLEFYKRRERDWIKGPPSGEKVHDISAFRKDIIKGDGISEIDIVIDGIRCASCVWLIERFLEKIKGIEYVRINYATHRARIRWRDDRTDIEEIINNINRIGYTPRPFTMRSYVEGLKEAKRDLLIRFGTASFFSMQLMMYSIALYAGYFEGMERMTKLILQIIALLLATPVVFYSGMPFIKGAIRGLRRLNFNMDVLIALGAISAYIYSIFQIPLGREVYFDTSAMIITLILLGRYIETGARGKASDVISRLLSLAPVEAKVVKITGSGDRTVKSVSISSIREGDMIEVSPGERIPLDGVVIEGSSEVDESMLTGESRPVMKATGDEVFCGTQNLYGSMVFRVNRVGEETVLSRIIKTVEDIQSSRPPVQALADRVVGIFVPSILILSITTGIGWFLHKGSLSMAIMNSISVLVIACPCALGLATPLTILAGTGLLASRGIVIKRTEIIERLRNTDTVVFDKTGTLTEGRPGVVSFKAWGISEEEALMISASLEAYSEHTIGKAIVDYAGDLPHHDITDFKAIPGKGVMGRVEGREVLIGNRAFVESDGIKKSGLLTYGSKEEESGNTVVYLSIDGEIMAFFVISDTPREEAHIAVRMLKDRGYRVKMITGDNQPSAIRIGRLTGIPDEDVMAEMDPLMKAEAIRKMQREGKSVIMAGDGINDAPALSQADAGISMGRATDIALESSDVVLMRNDLRLIPQVMDISKRISRIIGQNLFWALIYNGIAIPLAISGILHPIISAISMTLSSLSVVGNSMRLRRA
jgi:Cu2+-exporting ATPase